MCETIFIEKKLGTSWITDMNFLFQTNNIYIMDNHLAALWCWEKYMQNNTESQEVTLYHIDRHEDFKTHEASFDDLDIANKIKDQTFQEYCHEMIGDDGCPRYHWNNYINYFAKLYSGKLKFKSLTIKQDSPPDYLSVDRLDNIDAFFDEDLRSIKPLILNIDVDYFYFDKGDNDIVQLYSNELIKYFCETIKKDIIDINNDVCLTIALSPECCGGWNNAITPLEDFNTILELNLPIAVLRARIPVQSASK